MYDYVIAIENMWVNLFCLLKCLKYSLNWREKLKQIKPNIFFVIIKLKQIYIYKVRLKEKDKSLMILILFYIIYWFEYKPNFK